MGIIEIFIIAAGLSADAFAVSVCIGLSQKRAGPRACITAGLYFGIFQALMPLLGFLLGSRFADMISSVDHWVAFALLAVIGIKMASEGLKKDNGEPYDADLSPKQMLPLAVATSIDALAVGVSFAFLNVDIVYAVSFIGATTFALSAAGVVVGSLFGMRFKSAAEVAGGGMLIIMGGKILAEHLFLA